MTLQHGPAGPHELRLELPAAHSAERMARAVLRQFAQRERVAPEEIDTLEFVAGELLTNAVDHGGGQRAMHESEVKNGVRMTMHLDVRPTGWTLRVSDQGGGDLEVLRSRIQGEDLPDLEDERGRGFFLLAQMVDSLEVERTADGRGVVFIAVRTYPGG